jgi:hypothetical protein
MRSVWLGYEEIGRRPSGPTHRARGVSHARSMTADEGEHEAERGPVLPDIDALLDGDEVLSGNHTPLDPDVFSDGHEGRPHERDDATVTERAVGIAFPAFVPQGGTGWDPPPRGRPRLGTVRAGARSGSVSRQPALRP